MKGYKQFLDKENFNKNTTNLKISKVKVVNNGFIIHLYTNYICLYYKRVTTGKNGTVKIVTKINKNYYPKYQVTTYENDKGEEPSL